MKQREIAITGMGIVSALGMSPGGLARRLLKGDSGISKTSLGSGVFVAACVRTAIKTSTADRWPISRSTALGLKATQSVFPQNGAPVPGQPRLGLIHATAYGNLQSLLNYQTDLRKFGLRRASPMQFPNTILHAAASFLSIMIGATAFNITLSNENASGADAIEMGAQLLRCGVADRVLVVTSEDVAPELIPILESYDEIAWTTPDPFGEKRAGYVPGEAAVALLLESCEQAQREGKTIYARLCGSSGVSHGPISCASCEDTMKAALENAHLSSTDVGCVFASANGSRSDGHEGDAIAGVFGDRVPVTTPKAAVGECGASGSLLSIATAIACAQTGFYPPTLGKSRYDKHLKPIQLLREKTKITKPFVLVNAFSKGTRCAQAWRVHLSPRSRIAHDS